MKTPLGIVNNNYFYYRCCKSVFDENYFVQTMKDTNDIKLVVVLDEVTKKATGYELNDDKLSLGKIVTPDAFVRIQCKRVENIGDWMINKIKTQKSLISDDEIEKIVTTLEHRDYNHSEITMKDKSELGKGLRNSANKTEYEKALSDVSLSASESDIEP